MTHGFNPEQISNLAFSPPCSGDVLRDTIDGRLLARNVCEYAAEQALLIKREIVGDEVFVRPFAVIGADTDDVTRIEIPKEIAANLAHDIGCNMQIETVLSWHICSEQRFAEPRLELLKTFTCRHRLAGGCGWKAWVGFLGLVGRS
jgi:hypothetical protein